MRNPRDLDVWLERGCHLAAVGFSVTAAFLLRFDFAVPEGLNPILLKACLIAALVKLPIFDLAGFYRGIRRFVSTPDLYRLFAGNLAGSMLFAAVSRFVIGPGMPRSIWIIDGILAFVTTTLVRFSVRIFNEAFVRGQGSQRTGILIYGAGTTGAELIREIHSSRSNFEVKGLLDDDPQKRKAMIFGVPVLGTGRDAHAVVRRLNRRNPAVAEIIIAMPGATGRQIREALANCRTTRLPCKTVPGVESLLSGKALASQVRSLSVHDLLGRKPVQLDEAPIHASIAGRSVMITGAAGSIGSELCRQIARFKPARLVAFDQAESDLFRIENEMREKYPDLELVPALGDVRQIDRLAEVISRNMVDSIFHAAAYKHVPMMESHVLEAVHNNILGTWNLVRAARMQQHVRGLLMISSDKAVNPICVMGATKRACEHIVAARRPGKPDPKCVSVRFGNVLGSNGSVVPIFQAQIAAGGPVKVTHPEARRYFMTISEAVSLVVQAYTRSHGSEIFVLDMGEPMRIVDLAENMIRLAGLVPYEDIDIQFTGLRPGEKLIEELNGHDGLSATYQEKVRIFPQEPVSWDGIAEWIGELEELLAAREEARIIEHLQGLVPEYRPAEGALEPGAPAAYPVLQGSVAWTGTNPKTGEPTAVPRQARRKPLSCEL